MNEGTGSPTGAERWAGPLRRIGGYAALLVVPVLALEIFLLAYGDPALYDRVAGWWWTGAGRASAVVLVGALAFHGADHARLGLARRAPRFPAALASALEALLVLAAAGYAAWALFGAEGAA